MAVLTEFKNVFIIYLFYLFITKGVLYALCSRVKYHNIHNMPFRCKHYSHACAMCFMGSKLSYFRYHFQ